MEVGARVWIEDRDAIWLSAVIEECLDGDFVRARLDDGSVITRPSNGVVNGKLEQIIHLRNDQEDFTTVPDLISLQYLHEPELLYAVCDRYAHDFIYTYIGEILLSFNPFQRLNIYSHKYVQTYATSSDQDASLPPHVFAIAANAYKSLCDDKKNQSILVSGESGAGKTENTKFLMQYLTDVGAMDVSLTTSPCKASMTKRGGSRGKAAAPTAQIQTQILQTNPILEAFGNARTVRNDNSSRFGKFIELQFGDHHKIVGAKLSVYLLEKIRVSHQSDNERNFHIFYELCAGADDELAAALSLSDAEDFALLNESGCFTRRDGVDDAAQFQETSKAFTDMGILQDEQRSIFGIVAALLHLGNVGLDGTTCEASNMEHATIDAESRHHLDTAATLLGVSPMELTQALVTRHVTTTKDKIMVKLSPGQANEAKQSLTQSLFGGLFKWIVARLSSVIRHDAASVNTIGILDIFGFENLVSNGFEQLCINYANERLQSQFNDLVFAKEQRMYEAEGIEWKYIEYPDNAPCLQLLEDRPMGMWCLLDEEGMLPKGTNEGWITKLYSQYLDDSTTVDDAKVPTSRRQSCPEQGKGKMPSLSQPTPRKPSRPFFSTSSQRVEFQFVVGHFAGRVVYENDTYLEKNQDALPGEALELCRSSSNEIVQSLLQLTGTATASGKRGGASKSRKPPVVLRQPSSIRSTSVSAQFKSQLDDLIQVIGSTQARYIRCVKPNDVHTPRELNKARVVQQLRSGGVLEAVRIARAGYAVRVDHGSFVDAFGFFKPRTSAKKDLQGVCEQIVAAIMLQFYANDAPGIVDIATTVARGQTARIDRQAFHEACGSVGFQLGNSKIFFRKDVYNDLRRFRRQIMARHATLLQRNVRGFLGRKVAAARRRAAAVLQTWMRQCLAYRARVRASVLKLQTWVRSRVAMSKYHRFVRAMETLQKFGRHVLWTTRFQAKVQMRVVMRPPLEIPKPRQTTTPRAKTTPTKKSAAAPRVSATKANGRSRHGHDDDDDDGQEQRGTGDAVLAALTLQNELLKQELDILRKQTAAQVQIHLNRVDTMPPGPSSHAPTEEYAVFDPAEHSYGYGHPSMAPPPAFYHPDQFSPPPPAPPAPAFTELEFAHQQIISLSQQLLVTQIKYSNLLMDYNEHLCGYDADKPALSDDAFAMVEALDIPCPATLDCAQEQLRALLRKLHMAQEKLKHLEADMYGQFTNDSGFAVATGAASMLLHPNATKMTRGESIDTVEFTPRRSSEWRPHFDDHIGGSSRQLHSMALPAIHDYDNDECMSEVDNLEYEQKVEELQRQVDLLRMSVMHKPRATNSHGATMAMTASTVSSSRSSIGSMTEGQLADLRRSFGYRPNTPRRLTYHVKDVTTWARDDKCFECKVEFGFFTRRHHCRMCSQSFCHEHSNRRARLVGVGSEDEDEPVRVCDVCFVDICNESRRQEQLQMHVRQYPQRNSVGGAASFSLD